MKVRATRSQGGASEPSGRSELNKWGVAGCVTTTSWGARALTGRRCFITHVSIQNGLGSTASINGKGNLIIGYDEPNSGGDDKSGSHNCQGTRTLTKFLKPNCYQSPAGDQVIVVSP